MKPKTSASAYLVGGPIRPEQTEQFFIEMIFQMMVASGAPNHSITQAAAERIGKIYFSKHHAKMKAKKIPESISTILELKEKKQIDKLDGVHLVHSDDFHAFIYNCKDAGFTHESWFDEYLPANTPEEKLPELIQAREDGSIEVVGETEMSEGQLKVVVKQRKVMSVHFFSKGDQWHCFFFSFNDVQGKHGYMGEHVHYISHLWTVPREKVEESLRKRDHSVPSIHIKWKMEKNTKSFKMPRFSF